MRRPSWVAEEPEMHLLPHIERSCRTLLLEVEDAQLSDDGSFDVRLVWKGQGWRVGEIRAAVFALVGSFAEVATFVRQRLFQLKTTTRRSFSRSARACWATK